MGCSNNKFTVSHGCALFTVDRDAVFAGLRNINSCNPILRAQARATLSYYTG